MKGLWEVWVIKWYWRFCRLFLPEITLPQTGHNTASPLPRATPACKDKAPRQPRAETPTPHHSTITR